MSYFYEVIKEPPKKKEKRIMIVGMPGIGNVAKLSLEYIIDVLKPQKSAVFASKRMPVFSYIDSSNKMKLPEISLYQKKFGTTRVFFLSGDYQPLSEEDMFSFCELLLEFCKSWNIKEIVCTGGVGLPHIPDDPGIYASTATSVPKKIESLGAKTKIHGVISTIAGVTGLLPVLSEKYKITSVPRFSLLISSTSYPDFPSLDHL